MLIRPATRDDVPAIAALMNALITTTTIEWRDEPHEDGYAEVWLEEHQVVLVAEDTDGEGGVVGVAAYRSFGDDARRPGYRFAVENTIHVREDHCGRGVGRRLIEALVAEARAAGKHTMVAFIDGDNAASIALHERFGFVEVGRLPELGGAFGRWLDLVLLQLRLDDRPTPDA